VRGVLWPQGEGFEFRVVPPGDYWLVAASRPSPGGDFEFASQRLSVAGQPYKDVRIVTAPAARCTGRVELDNGAAAVPAGTTVVAHQTEFEVPLPAGVDPAMVTRAPVDAAGGFTFPALFGPRVLRLDRVPDSWALRSVRLDGIDITDRPTDFRGGAPACTLSLGVTTTAASIGGVVRDERGRPVPQARVVILPEDLNRRGPLSRYVKSAKTGSDGRFRITSVLPGLYGIAAVPYLDEGAGENLETLVRLQAVSVPQTIEANDRAEVTLTLKPLR
jgi:hypothetical protein